MNHILVTRCSFEDKPLLRRYLDISRRILVPALNAQTTKAFTWIVICRTEDRELLARELEFPFCPVENRKELIEYAVKTDARIQTRHDVDDYLAPEYIETIQSTAAQLLDGHPQLNRFLIQSQPLRMDLSTGQERAIKLYTETRTSMHLSLVQRTEVSTNVFARMHKDMWREVAADAGAVVSLPGHPTRWVIWGGNLSLNPKRA